MKLILESEPNNSVQKSIIIELILIAESEL